MHFKALFFLSCAVSILAATVPDVMNDITLLGTQLGTVTTLTNAFPNIGGTSVQALLIHTAGMVFQGTVDATTSDVQAVPLPISDADGRAILDGLLGLEPIILAASNALIAKKTAFQLLSPLGFPTGGSLALVRQDLSSLNVSLNSLEDAMDDSAPTSLLAEGNALRDRINLLLSNTAAAYA